MFMRTLGQLYLLIGDLLVGNETQQLLDTIQSRPPLLIRLIAYLKPVPDQEDAGFSQTQVLIS